MSIAPLLTEGIGPGGTVPFLLTGGLHAAPRGPGLAIITEGVGPLGSVPFLLTGGLGDWVALTLSQSPRYTAAMPPITYVAIIPGNAMHAIRDLPPIAPRQVETIACDFGFFLAAGETLTGTPTVTVLRDLNGIDLSCAILSGAPQIGTAALPPGSNVANAAVLQQLKNGVSGALYLIEVTCARSDGTPLANVAEGYFKLPCRAPQ